MSTPVPEQATAAEQLAQQFHETYERLAPSYRYETRKASAVPWADVPEPNRSLMIAVAGEVLEAAAPAIREDERQRLFGYGDPEQYHGLIKLTRADAAIAARQESEYRVAELEQLTRDILATFTKGQDGYRARAGQLQIAKWETVLKGSSS